MGNKLDSFGSEPAFDDVDGSIMGDRGMFGLPLFGGIPNAGGAAQEPSTTQSLDTQQEYRSVSPHQVLSRLGSFSSSSPEDLGYPQTTSPSQLYLPGPSPPASASAPTPTVNAVSTTSLTNTPPSPLVDFKYQPETRTKVLPKGRQPTTEKKKKKPSGPTGTRRQSRPLLDAAAPTMTKCYQAPGATTRKLIPAGFQKKLKLQADTSGDASLPASMESSAQKGLLDEIEEKRRRNCVAARESRRRKVEYQSGLKNEITSWRAWADEVKEKLASAGLDYLLTDMQSPLPTAMDLEE